MSVRILIADDHAVVRQGVRRILAIRPEWEICGEAETGQAAVRLAQDLKPDVIIMDVSMPQMNGIEATRELTKTNPSIAVLIFTMHESCNVAETAKQVGARGLVTKSEAIQNLVSALESLHRGGTFFPGFAAS
jgi:DNA-binding NarL/FixJ family response regulator